MRVLALDFVIARSSSSSVCGGGTAAARKCKLVRTCANSFAQKSPQHYHHHHRRLQLGKPCTWLTDKAKPKSWAPHTLILERSCRPAVALPSAGGWERESTFNMHSCCCCGSISIKSSGNQYDVHNNSLNLNFLLLPQCPSRLLLIARWITC